MDLLLNFKAIFLGVFLGALPFLLLSAMVSAYLHTFVTDGFLERFLPEGRVSSIFCATCAGVFMPSCDCGMVPLTRRLIHKGLPVYTAVAFMLSAPIVNPMVLYATYFAFNDWRIMALRAVTAIFVAFCAGLLVSYFYPTPTMKEDVVEGCSCGCEEQDEEESRLSMLARVGAAELFDMGKYLVYGAAISAALQTFLPSDLLASVGSIPVLSTLLMMLFAYLITICSAADAFIAASFTGIFPLEALVALMVYGPMMDLKNTFMLNRTFERKFVSFLLLIVTALCFLFSTYFCGFLK